ncbi:hypothetical protein MPL3365_230074 [Mesorhizobium plurifarium]|uniref:Uncharacterized protein n=1 Tax=Mesorhizobium plurifarium TaxID=69974 RepID=A0A090GUE6_MESPL|nr:hypothetical protein MPL3365_230074 [Mesorhizobium plurifarium]
MDGLRHGEAYRGAPYALAPMASRCIPMTFANSGRPLRGGIKAYRVEEMDGDVIVATHAAEAKTPFQAAERALGTQVTLRGSGQKWVRVIELTDMPPTRLKPASYEFRTIGKKQIPAR